MYSLPSIVVIFYVFVFHQAVSFSIVLGGGSHQRSWHAQDFHDSSPLVVIPLTSFVNPFNVGQDLQIEAKVKSLGHILNGIRSGLEQVAGNVIQNLDHLRNQFVVNKDRNRVSSTRRIGRLFDEQILQAKNTAVELRKVFLAGVKEGARDDMTPRKAVKFVGETIGKSLNSFWNQRTDESSEAHYVQRAEERKDEEVTIISQSRKNGHKETNSVRHGMKLSRTYGNNSNSQIPEELRKRLELLRQKLRARKKTDSNFAPRSISRQSEKPQSMKDVVNTLEHDNLAQTAIKLGNNTISELLSTLGHDCLVFMVCKAGALPESMGSFGPWAVQNFDELNIKQDTRENYLNLVEAYNYGKRLSENHKQVCAARFDKCEFFHTYESAK